MVAPVTVTETDLRTLLGIVACRRDDLPPYGLPPSLLADLLSLIRCDAVEFFGVDTGQQTFWFDQQVPPDDLAVDIQVYWDNFRDSDTRCLPRRSGDLRNVTKLNDFYSARQWHSTGLYTDYFRLYGTERILAMHLPAGPGPTTWPGRIVRLEFTRDERHAPDFSERDRALLALLRPHLHQAYVDAERRRHPVSKLTPRQWELLRLVAAGHTNAQIARRLGVSEGTVRIHLQNIYGRLQVSSRTAAVTRAFPDLAAL
jgi:DNA-binding CsgD family transcriptional regulator